MAFEDEEIECLDCIEARKEGYTICGECSVPYCHCCCAMKMSQCVCGPRPDND